MWILALMLPALAAFALMSRLPGLTAFYLLRQDGLVLAGLMGLLAAAALPTSHGAAFASPQVRLTYGRVALAAGSITLLLWAGTYLLLDNYPLTRDEHMVVFDMGVFRRGHLATALPVEWRYYANALIPAFLLQLPANAAWVSAYMPGNAMLRTAFGAALDPALFNPMLAGIGGVALFDIARRLFPERPATQAVALLMYATSAQVLVTAMTTYAMTAHLAVNLLWLALYLRSTRAGHAGAIVIGFVGIGLHQVIFHPLFAAPFVVELCRNRQRRTAAAYAISYAIFGLFWLSYPHLVAASAGLEASAGSTSGSGGYIADRILPLLTSRDPETLPLMAANMIRFLTWQNLALCPLMMLSGPALRRGEGIARPLAYGLLLTFLAMAIVLPYQGHGWGYRYLHGLVGSCALLAAYGWREFSDRQEVQTFVRLATLATMFAGLPFLLWQAHRFVDPYARVNRMIEHIGADIVVVETEGSSFAIDEVRNDADLSNRPLRLAGKNLSVEDIAVLCRRGSVAFVDVTQMHAAGLGVLEEPVSPHFRALRQAADASQCAGSSTAR